MSKPVYPDSVRNASNTGNQKAIATAAPMVTTVMLCSAYVTNPGGSGLDLPLNNSALFLVSCLGVAVGWRGEGRITPATLPFRVFILAAILLIVPILYTRPEWVAAAGWRVIGLITGFAFYYTCLSKPLRAVHRRLVLYLILIASGAQGVMGLLQMFAPSIADYWVPLATTRAVGIFQQANVLASFLATGLALALMAFLLPSFALKHRRCESWRCVGLGFVLVLFSAVLVWAQSRTGWLGGILVTGLFLWYFGRRFPRRTFIALLLLVSGVLLAILVMRLRQDLAYQPHDGSDHARTAMLFSSLKMIAEKPWLGWGYGGFEYSFQHFRLAQGLSTEGVGIARHPHNEILLWWVEGGMVGLLGMLLLLAAGVLLLRQAWRYDRKAFATGKRSAGQAMALCFTLVPILLHTQTEYPFYLSAIHWIVFLMLLAMLDRMVSPVGEPKVLPKFWQPLVRGGVILFSVAGMLTMAAGLYTGMLLTQAEKTGFTDMNKVLALPAALTWMHNDRWQFDRHLYMLLRFNQTGDEQLLENYAQWAQGYLNHRIDKNVYANLLVILRYQQQAVKAEEIRREANTLFPSDSRFQKQD